MGDPEDTNRGNMRGMPNPSSKKAGDLARLIVPYPQPRSGMEKALNFIARNLLNQVEVKLHRQIDQWEREQKRIRGRRARLRRKRVGASTDPLRDLKKFLDS